MSSRIWRSTAGPLTLVSVADTAAQTRRLYSRLTFEADDSPPGYAFASAGDDSPLKPESIGFSQAAFPRVCPSRFLTRTPRTSRCLATHVLFGDVLNVTRETCRPEEESELDRPASSASFSRNQIEIEISVSNFALENLDFQAPWELPEHYDTAND